jgi:hypothetical protein
MLAASRAGRWSPIDIIVRWWRNWSEADSCLAEPPCPADRTVPMSEDIGVSALDFRTAVDIRALAAHGPEEATLLPRRMAALGLEPDEVAHLEPRVFRGLSWRCVSCETPGQCAWDLADDFPLAASPEWRQAWQDYCPNAATLSWLGEMPWFRRANGGQGRSREKRSSAGLP